jgi:deazaflavin-dependent oxidoreductase (nitroreductase family)
MPVPRGVTLFAKHVANPIIGRFAANLPGFAMLHHVGRRSGKQYRNPVNVFQRDGDYIIALTYGPEVDWARNVLAAGQCQIRTQGRIVNLGNPTVETDPSLWWAPAPIRPVLKAAKIFQYMRLRPTG